MTATPRCPKCQSENAYFDGNLWVCPECFHEWSGDAAADSAPAEENAGVRDSNGTALADGDSVTVIKELKVKGASGAIKVGTKVKNIRLIPDATDGHNIACKIDGIGALNLKSEFVRKA
ncbi:alkylphosphonate utilization operon protein PhnA [Rhodomicrobium vannielii ATCC 17100]|uniref:Alkylphosphonate utilization operon protein PhnA n=1 Tax=Rhodomicrobium vannielii (strain ATCC 17100 / DSM 162 / LMG 4299 / NCIMB 10020 / ATH 3.1.1) TaxID=648757 RepID=E3HZ97_RHOVT|nr:zinc ribbon domain-containing protein YjdM [Rhodomicrobium vannielii]ADP69843.1 alkylphosphonate utilization operon protein PhnA [Rhodomicrobium vannielii ATCC 17100]